MNKAIPIGDKRQSPMRLPLNSVYRKWMIADRVLLLCGLLTLLTVLFED